MSADRDRMIPAPMGDCPVCGEPITDDAQVVWRNGEGGWTHMVCDEQRHPAPPNPPNKEAN